MNRLYELVLMLDPEAADADRDRAADEVRTQIEQGGKLEKADSWGTRKMAYEIRRRNEADYRYFRFEGTNELLERLDHNLKIAEGTLRFRIFKVDPDTPSSAPPVLERPTAGGESTERERRPRRGDDH
jgi:small subunit ribosomal protein S6